MDLRLKAACKWLVATPYKIADRVWIAESYILPSVGYACRIFIPDDRIVVRWQSRISKAIVHSVCFAHKMKEQLICAPVEQGGCGVTVVSDWITRAATAALAKWINREVIDSPREADLSWTTVALPTMQNRLSGNVTAFQFVLWNWLNGNGPFCEGPVLYSWDDLKKACSGGPEWDEAMSLWKFPQQIWGFGLNPLH